ncbi:dihydrolipoyl dehydrogenase [Bacillus sp. Bva_UNVM-123]|uniref:dihydrolipoyl dehydrogenase n=1 Tax=Bacillus sp. Bva_UNVM-123 TaxID=2829798 RepID=UPI00391FB8AF
MEGKLVKQFDLVVIGAGPGGYVSAIKAAQLGQSVAVVEREKIGGTCLNVGCIPSKAYLKHAEWLLSIKEANQFGVQSTVEAIDFSKLVERKDKVVSTLQGGINHLFKQNEIAYFTGEASIAGKTVTVNGENLRSKNILLATGSKPFVPPIAGIEEVAYLTTDTFFELRKLPKQLVIIGGGVIAVELAFAMAPLNVSVTILEVAEDILLTEDPEARAILKKKLQQLGIVVETKVNIQRVTKNSVHLQSGKTVPFKQLLLAAGRKANLALPQEIGLELDEAGRFVKVNKHYETSKKGIYAIGDMIGGYMLAHAASAEGLRAVAHMAGIPQEPLNQASIPRCIYTTPEVASFGLSEAEAKQNGYDVKVSKLPYSIIGKAIATNDTEGFVKIISEKKYNEILGAVIVGSHATETIHTLLAVKQSEGRVDELANLTFAHPTLSELTDEVSNSIISRAIHG